MNKSKIFFSSYIVDASNYRALKIFRYVLYSIGMLVAFLGLYLIPEFIKLFIFPMVLATIGVYIYSRQTEIKGLLGITEKGFEIEQDGVLELIPYSEIKDLKIERGATYHHIYENRKDDVYIYENDNWLKFNHNGKEHQIEFQIDSQEKNREFEMMLMDLKKEKVRYQFFTI